MATETRTRRQASAQKAAATRKRNQASRSATATKSSARRTTRSARDSATATTREAKRTARSAGRTTLGGLDAVTSRLGVFGRQAERAWLIQVGAVATVRDGVVRTARTYSHLDSVAKELARFESRGERVVRNRGRGLRRRGGRLESRIGDAVGA